MRINVVPGRQESLRGRLPQNLLDTYLPTYLQSGLYRICIELRMTENDVRLVEFIIIIIRHQV